MSFLLVFSRFSMCYAAKCLINKIRRFSLRCFSRLTTFREFPNYNYSEQILIFRDSSKQLLPSQSLISTSSLLTDTNGSLFLLNATSLLLQLSRYLFEIVKKPHAFMFTCFLFLSMDLNENNSEQMLGIPVKVSYDLLFT